MCGIFGVVGEGAARFDRQRLRSYRRVQESRGPDSYGEYEDALCFLGHNRLRIIDLSERASQPMAAAGDQRQLVFNGEIYNYRSLRRDLECRHRFHSQSDTEVLLYLLQDYGVGALDRIEGMFAFAFWNRCDGSLLIARDRFGEKPLYYCEGPEYVGFASSVAALLHAGLAAPSLSPAGLFGVPWLGCPTFGRTPVRGVRSLKPAHYLVVKDGRAGQETSYWQASELSPFPPDTREEEVISTIDHLLRESVRDQLVADVPVGLFYSGGLDSSTIASYVREHCQRPLHTYSLVFDHLDYDESALAAEGAKFFAFDHTAVRIQHDDVLMQLPTFLDALDIPLADGLNTYLVAKAAHDAFTVSLSGVGGDEAFCGYSTFRYVKLLEQLRALHGVLPSWNGSRNEPISTATSWPARVMRYLAGGLTDPAAQYDVARAIYTFDELATLFTPEFIRGALDEESALPLLRDSLPQSEYRCGRTMSHVTRMELQRYLGPLLLPAIDVMSMRFSMEIRAPFLNRQLVEYLVRVPDEIKMPDLNRKRLLHRLMRGRLPEHVLRHRKRGFGLPLERWILEPGLRDIVTEVVASKRAAGRGIFQEAALKRALVSLDAYSTGERMHHQEFMRLWILYVIEEWIRRNCDD
ncbi:MAG: asparagine synthase (glutamine-hydrolyzing) [Candidatus Eisenbacteria bacterium]|uniref:asparagine synthase (glutamine-hydrolyzing) n=1 Tax=Eiseniibacteriota bacterium TaxID=2212470 RepID=A0A538TAE7_UNCEI|nr:MAG: asparagine synthase (glutamine-hydrolyzing) [Candidatus Eisenbacteria bacterium]